MKRTIISLLVLVVSAWAQLDITPQDKTASHDREKFRQLLQRLADFSPDPCGPPYGQEKNWNSANVESPLFEQAAELVTQELNTTPATPASPRDLALGALEKLEVMSAEINVGWPKENRFHFEVIDPPPALVVKITIRAHGRFFVLASPRKILESQIGFGARLGQMTNLWSMRCRKLCWICIPCTEVLLKTRDSSSSSSAAVVPGALASRTTPASGTRKVSAVLNRSSSKTVPSGLTIRSLISPRSVTSGRKARWSHCLIAGFHPFDTWDNPSLCAVDTYDLSGNDVRFRSRTYNRADIVPVAKAIEYAEQHDYYAVLGYCSPLRLRTAWCATLRLTFLPRIFV